MRKIILTVLLVSISVVSIKAQEIESITNGFPIEIQNVPYQVEQWVKVRLANGTVGWLTQSDEQRISFK